MTRHVGGNLEAGVQPAQAWSTSQQLAGYAEHVYTTDDDPPVETNSIRAWRDWAGLRNGQLSLRASNHRAPRVHGLGWALDPDGVWRPLRLDAAGALVVSGSAAPSDGPPLQHLRAWYRADDLDALASGAVVTSWPDRSGNNNDLATIVGVPNPTFLPTFAPFNNRPCVAFDGTQALWKANPNGWGTGTHAATVYVVMDPDYSLSTPNLQVAFGFGADASVPNPPGSVFLAFAMSGPSRLGVDTLIGGWRTTTGTTVGPVIQSWAVGNGEANALADFRINQEAANSVDFAPFGQLNVPNPVLYASLGCQPGYTGGDFFFGRIAEVLYYRHKHNGTERAQTLLYLAQRYGISLV